MNAPVTFENHPELICRIEQKKILLLTGRGKASYYQHIAEGDNALCRDRKYRNWRWFYCVKETGKPALIPLSYGYLCATCLERYEKKIKKSQTIIKTYLISKYDN